MMIECITEQSFLNFRWTFDRMLPSLPTPGAEAFAVLCQKLQPHGISPSGIFLDAPTTRLADVTLRVLLLEEERATLRIAYGSFELRIDYLSAGDEELLIGILEGIFVALTKADSEAFVGRAQIQLYAHLKLTEVSSDSFLQNHLHGGENETGLIPDTLYYRAKLSDSADNTEMRIGITQSSKFDNSLFVEWTNEYIAPDDLKTTMERFGRDCKSALALLKLNPKSALKEEIKDERTKPI